MKPAADARTRLPREPYPGLRPFLAFEAALLFGRERQVREVIERLQATQFVAVLGGSGSGKSSLIHALSLIHIYPAQRPPVSQAARRHTRRANRVRSPLQASACLLVPPHNTT